MYRLVATAWGTSMIMYCSWYSIHTLYIVYSTEYSTAVRY